MRRVMVVLAVLCLPIAAAGGGPNADTRPRATLSVAWQGAVLAARLSLPAVQVIGFTHRPVDDLQKRALADALRRLGQASNVLVPDPQAQCRVMHEKAWSDLALVAGRIDAAGPAGFHGRYTWHCRRPGALRGIDVPLLELLNGVPLATLVVTARGSRQFLLQMPQTRLRLGRNR